jgi:hypothetical protein
VNDFATQKVHEMNRYEFTEYVKQGCSDELVAYVPESMEKFGELLFQEHGKYYSDKRPSAIEFIGMLASLLAKDRDQGRSAFKITPSNMLTGDFLANKISPWVEMVRARLFGSPQSPFKSISDGIKWIEDEGKKHSSEITMKERKPLVDKLPEMVRSDSSAGVSVDLPPELLPYPAKNGWLERVRVLPGTPPGLLASETARMAKNTGFNQASLVMYILADIKPLLPRVRLTSHRGYYELPTGEALGSHLECTPFYLES